MYTALHTVMCEYVIFDVQCAHVLTSVYSQRLCNIESLKSAIFSLHFTVCNVYCVMCVICNV